MKSKGGGIDLPLTNLANLTQVVITHANQFKETLLFVSKPQPDRGPLKKQMKSPPSP